MLLFLYIVETTLESEFLFFDKAVSQFIIQFRNPEVTQIMKLISSLGNELILFVSAGIILLAVLFRKHLQEVILYSYIIVTGGLLNLLLKAFINRPRPEFGLIKETYSSLPSGHAMNSFVFYTCVAYFTYHFTQSRGITTLVSLGCFVMILLIGVSRVYLGVHYPTDIIAGYVAGFWWFCTAMLMQRTLVYLRRQ